jgi:hypothetical protein
MSEISGDTINESGSFTQKYRAYTEDSLKAALELIDSSVFIITSHFKPSDFIDSIYTDSSVKFIDDSSVFIDSIYTDSSVKFIDDSSVFIVTSHFKPSDFIDSIYTDSSFKLIDDPSVFIVTSLFSID